ncbi:T9SS type A sorting domain-containing protein, partial [Flavobacterium restrictum]|uniref:T9SS type A sorting domain-containing protein n=1 Tax=Flavobacterium restrictum TaxID=2594428 RepID=UPI00163D891E
TTASACDSYLWSVNGMTYAKTGIYTFGNGCVTETLDLTITSSSTNTTTASACDSYLWSVNGMTYAKTGIYTFGKGCVTETLDLTITPSSTNTTTASACDSYLWSVNGMTYAKTGIYTFGKGCVTETLDLTITPSSTNTTTASACDSYLWSVNGMTYAKTGIYTFGNGCVTETLDLTITPSSVNTTTASACDSYLWSVNGMTYAKTGVYTFVKGCVTETLDLTITPITTTVTAINGVLYSNTPNATYQWIDCTTNLPLSGEINQSFTPKINGTYAVQLTLNGCSVTSDCLLFVTLGTTNFDDTAFQFYPNPVANTLFLSYSNTLTSVAIINVNGQVVVTKAIQDTTALIDMSHLPSGTYVVVVQTVDHTKTFKVIKK